MKETFKEATRPYRRRSKFFIIEIYLFFALGGLAFVLMPEDSGIISFLSFVAVGVYCLFATAFGFFTSPCPQCGENLSQLVDNTLRKFPKTPPPVCCPYCGDKFAESDS